MLYTPSHRLFLSLLASLMLVHGAGASTSSPAYRQAFDSYQKEQYKAARDILNQIVENDPGDMDALILLGRAHIELGGYQSAERCFNEALKVNPKLGWGYIGRGKAIWGRRIDNERAVRDLKRGLQLDESVVEGYYWLADIYESRGQYRQALEELNKAVKANPERARSYRKRGQVYMWMGDKRRALQEHDKSLEIEPDNISTIESRASAHLFFDDFKGAAADFAVAAKIEPNRSRHFCNWGGALYKAGEYRKALEILKKASSVQFESGTIHTNLGMTYEKLGDLKKAREEYDLAVKYDPKKREYYKNHARLSMKTSANADETVDDFIGMDATRSQPIDVQRKSELILVDQYSKLIEHNRRDASNYYNRAVARFCLGQYEDAQEDLTEYRNLNGWRGAAPIYGAILRSLALRHLHRAAEEENVLAEAAKHAVHPWSRQLIMNFQNKISDRHFLEGIDNLSEAKSKIKTVRCFLGLKLICDGKIEQGKDLLQWVCDNTGAEFDEHSLAASALARLDPKAASADSKAKSQEQSNREYLNQAPEIKFKDLDPTLQKKRNSLHTIKK